MQGFGKSTSSDPLTSLPLQLCLHFNLCFVPLLLTSCISCFTVKYTLLTLTYQVLLTSLFIVFCIVEIVRLYLGYYGNIREKIPALSGFWVTSLLIQLPLSLFFLLNDDIRPLRLEKVAYTLHSAFLIGEVVTGFNVIQRIANHQVAQFRLQVEEDTTK